MVVGAEVVGGAVVRGTVRTVVTTRGLVVVT